MNFDDEYYIKVYVRDTLTMLRLPWQGRFIWWEILRKVDRFGQLELGGGDAADAISQICRCPRELALEGLAQIGRLERPIFTVSADGVLLIHRFVEAQSARKSPALRQRVYRQRQKAPNHISSTDQDASSPISNGTSTNGDTSHRASALQSVSPSSPTATIVTKRDESVTEHAVRVTDQIRSEIQRKFHARADVRPDAPAHTHTWLAHKVGSPLFFKDKVGEESSEKRITHEEVQRAMMSVWNAWLSGWLAYNVSEGSIPPRLEHRQRRAIARRLAAGDAVEMLIFAVSGVWLSPWHVENKQYSLASVLHDSSSVAKFADIYRQSIAKIAGSNGKSAEWQPPDEPKDRVSAEQIARLLAQLDMVGGGAKEPEQ